MPTESTTRIVPFDVQNKVRVRYYLVWCGITRNPKRGDGIDGCTVDVQMRKCQLEKEVVSMRQCKRNGNPDVRCE